MCWREDGCVGIRMDVSMYVCGCVGVRVCVWMSGCEGVCMDEWV